MKVETRDLLRSVVQLADRDLSELRDSVAEIDERESRNRQLLREQYADVNDRLSEVESWAAPIEYKPLNDRMATLTEAVAAWMLRVESVERRLDALLDPEPSDHSRAL